MAWEPMGGSGDLPVFFDAHGWAVLRGGVSPAEIAGLRASFDAVMEPRLHVARATAEAGGAPLPGVWQLPGVCRSVQGLLDPLRSGLAQIAANLLGASELRLLQDSLLLKRAGSSE